MTDTGSSRRDRTRFVLAAVFTLVGLVWLGQGVGIVPGSFMSGDAFWAIAGVMLILASAAYATWPRLRRR